MTIYIKYKCYYYTGVKAHMPSIRIVMRNDDNQTLALAWNLPERAVHVADYACPTDVHQTWRIVIALTQWMLVLHAYIV